MVIVANVGAGQAMTSVRTEVLAFLVGYAAIGLSQEDAQSESPFFITLENSKLYALDYPHLAISTVPQDHPRLFTRYLVTAVFIVLELQIAMPLLLQNGCRLYYLLFCYLFRVFIYKG